MKLITEEISNVKIIKEGRKDNLKDYTLREFSCKETLKIVMEECILWILFLVK